MARKAGEDEEKWGSLGLVHDLDYEMYPSSIAKWLKRYSWKTGGLKSYKGSIKPRMELARMVSHVKWKRPFMQLMSLPDCSHKCLVRPSESVLDLEVRSVKRNGTIKICRRSHRAVIEKGASMLGVPLDDLIMIAIMEWGRWRKKSV